MNSAPDNPDVTPRPAPSNPAVTPNLLMHLYISAIESAPAPARVSPFVSSRASLVPRKLERRRPNPALLFIGPMLLLNAVHSEYRMWTDMRG